jgi:hypothetical protein
VATHQGQIPVAVENRIDRRHLEGSARIRSTTRPIVNIVFALPAGLGSEKSAQSFRGSITTRPAEHCEFESQRRDSNHMAQSRICSRLFEFGVGVSIQNQSPITPRCSPISNGCGRTCADVYGRCARRETARFDSRAGRVRTSTDVYGWLPGPDAKSFVRSRAHTASGWRTH